MGGLSGQYRVGISAMMAPILHTYAPATRATGPCHGCSQHDIRKLSFPSPRVARAIKCLKRTPPLLPYLGAEKVKPVRAKTFSRYEHALPPTGKPAAERNRPGHHMPLEMGDTASRRLYHVDV